MKDTSTRIPIVALCGFLGAGKTTLLNHILTTQNGRRIAVIVNDFGSINVDSLLITSQTESTMELSNGSICCAVGEDGIDEMINQLAHKHSIIDLILIEASGAAEPTHLVQSLTRLRNRNAIFDSLIYVIDAYELENTIEKHPAIKEHIETADCIVLNKLDSVDAEKKTVLKQLIGLINNRALVIESTFGKVDVESLLGSADEKTEDSASPHGTQLSLTPAQDDHSHEHHHHAHVHDKLFSTTFKTKEPIDPKAFAELMDNPPTGLYRLKGWVNFGVKGIWQTFIVQLVGSRWRMHLHRGNDDLSGTEFLVIGNNEVNKDDILALLKNCEDKNPDSSSKEDMVDIFRYDTEY